MCTMMSRTLSQTAAMFASKRPLGAYLVYFTSITDLERSNFLIILFKVDEFVTIYPLKRGRTSGIIATNYDLFHFDSGRVNDVGKLIDE